MAALTFPGSYIFTTCSLQVLLYTSPGSFLLAAAVLTIDLNDTEEGHIPPLLQAMILPCRLRHSATKGFDLISYYKVQHTFKRKCHRYFLYQPFIQINVNII